MKCIFIHGLGQTEKSWDSLVSRLLISQPACPNLSVLLNSKSATYENIYKSFTAYCDTFHQPVDLCGLSLGGILALNYAIDYPAKVNSLILIGAQYKMPKTLLKLQNIIFKLMPNSLFTGMGFSKNDFISLTSSMASLDFSDSLSNVNCKSLIICGEKDSANKKAAISLSNKLKASKLVFIEKSSHEVNIDNPISLSQEIGSFYSDI